MLHLKNISVPIFLVDIVYEMAEGTELKVHEVVLGDLKTENDSDSDNNNVDGESEEAAAARREKNRKKKARKKAKKAGMFLFFYAFHLSIPFSSLNFF